VSPFRSCIPVSAINKESEVQCCTSVLLVITLIESTFALLTVQVKQEANALDMRNRKLNTVQKQNSMNQKVLRFLATGMDGL